MGKKRTVQSALLTIAVTIMVLPNYLPWGKSTAITFLDVGQGDCICVQLSSGEVYLFDCGSTDKGKVGEYVLKPYLKYCGITSIDAVMVSHEDTDHSSGVRELLGNMENWGITVEQLVLTRTAARGELAVAAASADVPVIYVEAGNYWLAGECRFTCLHPGADFAPGEANAASQCFYLELDNDMNVLLTGDVEGTGEALLLAALRKRGIEGIDLLKVPHHGSRFATGEALLAQISPRWAVISCARNNAYGHPHKETLERLEQVGSRILLTSEEGAIIME